MKFRLAAILAAGLFAISHPAGMALAQGTDYFIPGQQRPAVVPPRPGAPTPPRPVPRSSPPEQLSNGAQPGEEPPINVPLPPVPELPSLPRGATPPAAVIGVIGVPEVMRASVSAQQVERVIGERRAKLNEDAQAEQVAWRDMQQSLANERSKLSPEQIRTRERALQERITKAQKTFRDRNRIVQEAAQYALGQIERTLIGVIRQVAESRGMNLVLHRAQVALNVNEFDITDQVTAQLNAILPTVTIPADGVSPTTLPPPVIPTAPSAAPAASAPAAPAAPASTAAPAKPAAPAAPTTTPPAKK
jgi:Skp family chaperone for outer membrane proteins